MLNILDVGGDGSRAAEFRSFGKKLGHYIVANPLAETEKAIRDPSIEQLPIGLSHSVANRQLYIPANPAGSSLFPPNLEYVHANFARLASRGDRGLADSWASRSQTQSIQSVRCETIDSLVQQRDIGRIPHVIKLDTNGSELDILQGAKKTLEGSCVAVLAKLFTEPVFTGIPLFSEASAFLRNLGFGLVATSPPANTFLSQRYCLFIRGSGDDNTVSAVRELFGIRADPCLGFNWPTAGTHSIKDPLIILGNGPSLAEVDLSALKQFHTCGFNAAYRGFERASFWPTYLASLDYNLTPSHATAFSQLITQEIPNAISAYFFINSVSWLRLLSQNVHIIPGWRESQREYPKATHLAPGHETFHWCGNSAATMVEVFLNMGYRNFILLGVDAQYTEKLKFAKETTAGKLEIEETPTQNPNYWFGDYQQKGDQYSIPNAATAHVAAWEKLASYARARGDIQIVNGSPQSALTCFPKTDWRTSLQHFKPSHPAPPIRPARSRQTIGQANGPSADYRRNITDGFASDARASLDEIGLVWKLLSGAQAGLMIDVGAHHGTSMFPFLQAGWRAIAFEPDQNNRRVLEKTLRGVAAVTIDSRAVGEKSSPSVEFFASDESSGLSSLRAFTAGHKLSARVQLTTLTNAIAEYQIKEVDFLKIDTEGHDLFVLKGFPWETHTPKAIMCEFEDRKTLPLGYDFHDLCSYLAGRGYQVFVSEWHPIVRYGISHSFRRLGHYPAQLSTAESWGNLIALRQQTDYESLINYALGCIRLPNAR